MSSGFDVAERARKEMQELQEKYDLLDENLNSIMILLIRKQLSIEIMRTYFI